MTLLMLLTIGCSSMARTDIKLEYGSNVLANKIFESSNKEAQQTLDQMQGLFKDISFDVPDDVEENIQIKTSVSYFQNKFFYFDPKSKTKGVWIGANDSDSEITVSFSDKCVRILDEFKGGSPKHGTLVAYFDSGSKPKLININAKDLFVKRTGGGIIYAFGGRLEEQGTININTADSIYLFS